MTLNEGVPADLHSTHDQQGEVRVGGITLILAAEVDNKSVILAMFQLLKRSFVSLSITRFRESTNDRTVSHHFLSD